jgi:hypothetical protein
MKRGAETTVAEGFVCTTGPGKSPTFAESAKMGHPIHPALRNEGRGSYRTFIARAPSRARTRAGFACGFSGVYLQEARGGALVKSRRLRCEDLLAGAR